VSGWLAFVKSVAYLKYEKSDYYVNRGDIWIVRRTGGELHRLTSTGNYTAQSWLPPVGR